MPKKVEKWGVGKPDYHKQTEPSRTTIGKGQTTWMSYIEVDAPPNTTLTVPTSYVIPSGKKLTLGWVNISSSKDGIGRLDLLKNGSVVNSIWVDFKTAVPFTDTSNIVFVEGAQLGYAIVNTLKETANLRGFFSGFLSPTE